MNLETVTCNNCGAPLQVPAGARFVTCTHCQTSLEVHRDASVVYTEKVSEIADNTQKMAGELAELRRNSELERLDREWEQERQQYMIRGQHGEVQEPSIVGSMIAGVLLTVFSVFWIGVASNAGAPVALIGVVFLIVGIAVAINGSTKARNLAAGRQRYQRRRAELMNPEQNPVGSTFDSGRSRPLIGLDEFLNRAPQPAKTGTSQTG
jgi:LSD1 subclass zinc finger protein